MDGRLRLRLHDQLVFSDRKIVREIMRKIE